MEITVNPIKKYIGDILDKLADAGLFSFQGEHLLIKDNLINREILKRALGQRPSEAIQNPSAVPVVQLGCHCLISW